ncbi:MAG: hypothetical protein GY847_12595 [Proteobacteria bacterium]|nr:hypothetical protein [Pseudomonadota bacterium]
MKPIFTIHAGEYLVGAHIENTYKNVNVWVPTKDTGIDLLVTDAKNQHSLSYQVKYSKDWLITHIPSGLQSGLEACGWWTLNPQKIRTSKADFWVFVLPKFNSKKQSFIVIEPAVLLKRLTAIHGTPKTLQSYLWVTSKNKCWETRGLKKRDQVLVANDAFKDESRDFTKYLNSWGQLKKFNK